MNENTTPTPANDSDSRRAILLRAAGLFATGAGKFLTSLANQVFTGAGALFLLYWFTGNGPIPRELVHHLAVVAGLSAVVVLVAIPLLGAIVRRTRSRHTLATGGGDATTGSSGPQDRAQ